MADTGTDRIAALRHFVRGLTAVVDTTSDEGAVPARGRELPTELVSDDGWLPDTYAIARSDRYAQYLLHCDPLERFSMVSFVWGARVSELLPTTTRSGVWSGNCAVVNRPRNIKCAKVFRPEPVGPQ